MTMPDKANLAGNPTTGQFKTAIGTFYDHVKGLHFWQPGLTVNIGDIVFKPNSNSSTYAKCTTAGVTGTSEPIWSAVGNTTTDGTATWTMHEISIGDLSITGEKIAGDTITLDKLATTVRDMIAASSAAGSNSPAYYRRNTAISASDKTVIAMPTRLWVNIGTYGYAKETATTLDISTDVVWDTNATEWQPSTAYGLNDVIHPATRNGYLYRCTTAGTSSALTPTFPTTLGATYNDGNVVWICQLDNSTAANRQGKNFYIYACQPTTGTEPIFYVSENSTVPLKYTETTSRKIGGFHTLCANVGTISGHTLTGYALGNIIPASVWDLAHRPVSEPEGMAYIDGLDLWVDIYLSSYTGTTAAGTLKTQSIYGANTADGTSTEAFHWYKWAQTYGKQKKRMLAQREFMVASLGSNQGTNIAGSADANTAGGHNDTAGRRMISNYGLEDCCGFLWQWGLDSGAGGSGTTWVNAYDANDANVGGQHYMTPNRVLLGGNWGAGAYCGSRGSNWDYGPLILAADRGSRGASEPLRGV